MNEPILTEQELQSLTQFTQPRRQLEELKTRGFWRARLSRFGRVVLERAHYEAVCKGALPPTAETRHTDRPRVRLQAA